MATDATGTPTTLGIPKYNTSNDAPSGLGFNAAMDAIDALIQGRIAKPSGIAAGEVPVWDGSTFVRSSVTRVGPTSLGSGTPDGTKFLRDDGTWVAPSGGGSQLDRKTITADVSGITATTEGTAATILTSNSIAYAGTEVLVEFWAPGVQINSSGVPFTFVLLRDTTVLGQTKVWIPSGASDIVPVSIRGFDTPSAAAHTYTIKAFVGSNSGTVRAGVGGAGNLLPAFLRVTKA